MVNWFRVVVEESVKLYFKRVFFLWDLENESSLSSYAGICNAATLVNVNLFFFSVYYSFFCEEFLLFCVSFRVGTPVVDITRLVWLKVSEHILPKCNCCRVNRTFCRFDCYCGSGEPPVCLLRLGWMEPCYRLCPRLERTVTLPNFNCNLSNILLCQNMAQDHFMVRSTHESKLIYWFLMSKISSI